MEEMFAALTAAGAHVVTLTFPDVGKIVPLARPIRSRVFDLNTRIRAAAARHGVAVAETGRAAVATDPRLWSVDRLHASPLGHERIAAAVAEAIHLPGSDDAWTLPCCRGGSSRAVRPRRPNCAGRPRSSAPGSDAAFAAGPPAQAAPRSVPSCCP